MQESCSTLVLDNGMRVIHMASPTRVAYCGVAIDAGTRDERGDEQGMAHFCEHMLFKGTERRRSWHILNRMEAIGGDLNAYTNKEETVVHAAFMREHLARATELVLDIVFNSTFPQHEIDKEREVIAEEMESYNDSPAERIYDEFESIVYGQHPLGRDILGTPERVRGFRTDDALRFVRRLYRPERMVFFVFGDYGFATVRRTLERAMRRMGAAAAGRAGEAAAARPATPFPPRAAHRRVVEKGTHQAHVMLGCRAYPSDDPRRVALYFLNNILAGPGMNSRLNVALRERRGLVYTVESTLANYTDTSTFAIYFGCDASDVERCLRIVRKELAALAQTPLTDGQFAAAMRQIRGQIGVACDNFESYALDMAKSYLHYNRFEGVADTFRRLDKLTPRLLHDVARDLFADDNLALLIYR